MYNRDGPT